MEDRKLKEIEFHNNREKDRLLLTEEEYNRKYSNKNVYNLSDKSFEYLEKILKQYGSGKVCLDYCCGLGNTALTLYKNGAKKVYGIDIASDEVNTAKSRLNEAGFDSSGFVVGDAEKMNFPDSSFDLVVCIGVLHHLDVNLAFPEIHRVLRPGGIIIGFEALGYNPAIQLYRKLTPHLRTEWETEHILTLRELKVAKKYFRDLNVKYFHLANLVLVPLSRFRLVRKLSKPFELIDALLLRIPFIRLLAWQMVFVIRK